MSTSIFNVRRLLIAVIFTGAVLVLTHIPQEAIPSKLQVGGLDKIGHVLAYGAMTLLLIVSLRTFPSLLSALLLFLVILAIGTIDEITQPFVNRIASLADWLANVIGIVIVLLFGIIFKAGGQSTPNSEHMVLEE